MTGAESNVHDLFEHRLAVATAVMGEPAAQSAEVMRHLAMLDAEAQRSRNLSSVVQGLVVVMVMGIMAWAATEIQQVGKSIVGITSKLENIDTKFVNSDRLLAVELTQVRNEFRLMIQENRRTSEVNEKNIAAVQNSLKALEDNQVILRDAIRRAHVDLPIEQLKK